MAAATEGHQPAVVAASLGRPGRGCSGRGVSVKMPSRSGCLVTVRSAVDRFGAPTVTVVHCSQLRACEELGP